MALKLGHSIPPNNIATFINRARQPNLKYNQGGFMICKKISIKACTFVMTATMMLLSITGGAGAVPLEEWNKAFGGQYWDEAYSVQKVPDGGYMIIHDFRLF